MWRAEAPRVPVPGAEMKRARFYQDPDAPGAFADGGSVPKRARDDGGGEGWQRARTLAEEPLLLALGGRPAAIVKLAAVITGRPAGLSVRAAFEANAHLLC